MRVSFLMNRCAWIDIYHCHLVSARWSDALCSRCRFSGCVCGAASITSLKRGNIDHSDAADSFCAGCLIGVDRVAAARRAAFLRRKYVTRRLRLIRARSCCPMGSLWIENRRNAIGIATDRAFSSYDLSGSKTKTRGRLLIFGGSRPKRIPTLPSFAKKRRPVRGLAFIPWTTNRPLCARVS